MHPSDIGLYLQTHGFTWAPDEIMPDSKLVRFPISDKDEAMLGYCLAYQVFSQASGKPFVIIYYGDVEQFEQGELPSEYYSIHITDLKIEDRQAIRNHRKKAQGAIKKSLEMPEPAAKDAPDGWFIRPLGFKEKEYFFTSSHNQQIVGINKFTRADFFNLMPEMYWELKYPKQNGGADYDAATSDLMESARKHGIFQSRKIRGAGVWSDSGRVVVNMGDHLIVDGSAINLSEISSDNFYTLGIKLNPLAQNPLTKDECSVITSAAHTFKWKRSDFGYLIAGAMVTTRVAGALPIRPHLWIIGEKGAGKSTIFNRFIDPLIGEPRIFAAGNTTEAGIRQAVSANAIPVIVDEFENKGGGSMETLQSVLDLMRIAWSETNAVVLKGSATGSAQAYQPRFGAIVASVRQMSLTDADQSRYATGELAAHGDDPVHWKFLQSFLNQIDADLGNRLFARTIKMMPALLSNFKTMKAALARKVPGQRFGDQYGMLLAGYGILTQDEALTQEQAEQLAGEVQLEEEREKARFTDQDACLSQLLSKKASFQLDTDKGEKVDCSFGEAIERAIGGDKLTRAPLQSYGIRVDDSLVYIRSQNTELESLVYRGTRWSNSWGASLIRLNGATRKTFRVGGSPGDCVILPVIAFL